MKLHQALLALACSTLLTGSVFAEDIAPAPKAEKPIPVKKAPATKPVKLIKPWSLIDAKLSADQKEKIGKIHMDALEQRKAIDAKETEDVTALLTDDQKAELKTAMDAEKLPKPKKEAADKADGAKDKTDTVKKEPKKD